MLAIVLMFLVLAAGLMVVKLILKDDFTEIELAISLIMVLVVVVVGYHLGSLAKGWDTQVLSGEVTGKSREVVSCQHSYPCHCHEVCSGGKNGSCSTQCDTCYEHLFDVDWDVHTTVGTITIDRIDSQGLDQPPRWTAVRTNDPVSITSSFENYIKAVPESLYSRLSTQATPAYPDVVYDYYRVDRVVDWHADIPPGDLKKLNERIALDLREVAPAKQVNLVVVVTNDPNPMFAENLKAAWLGGKKNDLVAVAGVSQYPQIQWAEVFSWSKNDLINVTVRDHIRDHGVVDVALIDTMVADIDKDWVRKRMHEYEYLKHEITPSPWAYVIIFMVGLLSAVTAVIISINVTRN